jgi:hypothetical protein
VDIRNILIPVGATPVLQAILNYAGQLKLSPLGHWEWNEDIVQPITYIVSTGSAAVAGLLSIQTNRTKALLVALGLLVLIASLCVYTWLSTSPPGGGMLLLYDIMGYIFFFLTYIAFGFVVALVTKFFAQK